MSAISNSLLDAINKISESNVKASNATLTIECTITEVEDAGLQLYKVNYKDNIFSATSSSGSYNVGDIVYVLVPEGDFSKTKMIIGAVAPSSANLVEEEVTDDYIDISENLFGEIGDINLCSYKSEDTLVFTSKQAAAFREKLLNYINDGHRDFVFSMQIKTNLKEFEQQRAGNYGLKLSLPIVIDNGQGGTEHTYQVLNMDINSIIGNPYKLGNYTYQEIKYTFPNNVEYDISETEYNNDELILKYPILEKFVMNFPLQAENKDPDIFIKDISFKAVKTLSAEHKQGYYLSLVCKDGNYFVGEDSKKVIEPVLKINGKSSKIDTEKQDCYQFIEDSSINASSPEYTYIAKNGQRCLNDLNLETSQYITNVLSYEVKKESVIAEVRYRCSLVNMSEQIQKDAYITLTNKNKVIECSLTTVDNITTYPKDMGNVNLIATVKGIKSSDRIDLAWRRLDLDTEKELDDVITIQGTSYDSKTETQECKASMPVSAISGQANKIICTFYISNEDNYKVVTQKILGTKEIIVWTTAEMTWHITVQNGDILYKYDGNGNSPFVADYAYPYQAKKTIDDITFKVYKADGVELNEDEYRYCKINQFIPKNSMIKKGKDNQEPFDDGHYEQTGKDLNYKIEDVQNPKKTDNYIILTVNFKDINLTEEINIKFVKEGESGTNGSAYTGMITFYNEETNQQHTYDDIDDLKVCRVQLIYVKPKDKKEEEEPQKGKQYYNKGLVGHTPLELESLSFGINVWCNGEIIPSDQKLYDVEQSLFDESITNSILQYDAVNNCFRPKEYDNDKNPLPDKFCTIIAAKITVGDDGALYGQNEDKEIIYAYYPVEVIIIENPELIKGAFPYIAGGYSQVLYASDGTNPQFDSTNPFRVENDTSIINNYSNDYDYEQTSSSNIRTSSNGSIEYRGIPVNRYNNGESLNYIQVKIKPKVDEEGEIILPADIIEKLNEAIEKKNSCNKEIDALKYLLPIDKGGTNNFLNTFFNHFVSFKNDIMQYLTIDGMKEYLSDRQSILNKIEEIKKFIDKYKDKLSKYDQDLQLLHNLRTKLQNIGIIFNLTENDLLEKNGFVGDGLSEKTKRQFNNYRKQIDNALKSFIAKYKDSSIKDSFITLVNKLRDEDRVVSFESDSYTYEEFNIYTDLISLKETYYGIVNRLIAPDGSTEQEDDYAFISNYINIKNMIDQIDKIFTNLSEEKYENDTIILKEKKEEELAKLETEIAGLEELKRYFIDKGFVTISRPILMLYNRYEMSNIIGQDGNKLYIDDNDNPQYLLAPQIGAGRKDDKSLFTGMVMGIRGFGKDTEDKSKQTGLFGYHENIQTMFLNAEDGSAIFGKSGTGQIIIDPNENGAGLIYSTNYQKDTNYGKDGKPISYDFVNQTTGQGMLINLTNAYIHFGDSEDNHGRIYSGKHITINSKEDGFFLSRDGLSIGSKVKITEAGIAYFGTNAYNTDSKTENPKCQTINGDNDASYIGYKTKKFDSKNLDKYNPNNPDESYSIGGGESQVYIGTNGIRLGNQFAVDNNGNMVAKQLIAAKLIAKQDGEIGGQTIEGNQLKSNSNGMTIKGEGSLYGPGNNQYITSSGDAHFDDITCTNVFTIGKQGEGNNYQSSKDSGGGTSSFSFGNGSIGLTASPSAGVASGDQITFTPSGGLKIEGDITARNGTFTGTIFAKDGNIGGQHINTDRLEQVMEGAVGGQLSSAGDALLSLITCSDVIVGEYLHETKLSAILRDFNTRITNLENHNPH